MKEKNIPHIILAVIFILSGIYLTFFYESNDSAERASAAFSAVVGSGSLPIDATPTAWYDSTDTSTIFTGSGCTGAISDGARIGCWQDKSGNGNHAIQSTGSQQPQFQSTGGNTINGNSVIYFDGIRTAPRYFEVASNLGLNGTNPHTIFYVFERNTSDGDYDSLIGNATQNVSTFALRKSGANNALQLLNSVTGSSIVLSGSTVVTGNGAHVAATKRDGNNFTIYVEGASDATTTNSVSFNSDNMAIGNSNLNTDDPWQDGTINELIIYPSALNDTDRLAIECYLADKWGVTSATYTSNCVADYSTAPTDIEIDGADSVTLKEGTLSGTSAGTLTNDDPDSGDTHTYTLVAGTGDEDNGLFSIENGDELHFGFNPSYDSPSDDNGDNTYNVRIQVADNDSPPNTYSEALIVVIESVRFQAVIGSGSLPIEYEPTAWYDSSDGNTIHSDDACTSGNLSDGDRIGCWRDKSGNDNHAVNDPTTTRADNATTTDNPVFEASTLVNGRTAVQFAGVVNDPVGDDEEPEFLDTESTLELDGQKDFTFFAVFDTLSNAANDGAIIGGSDYGTDTLGTETLGIRVNRTTEAIDVTNSKTAVIFSGSDIVAENGIHSTTVIRDSNDWDLFVDGALDASTTNAIDFNDSNGPNTIALGMAELRRDALFNGNINEIIVYPRVLTLCERNSIEGYLANKWGTPYTADPSCFTNSPTAVLIEGGSSVQVEETNSLEGESAGTLSAIDADKPNDSFSYAIVGGADAALFSIGGFQDDEVIFEFEPHFYSPVDANDDNIYELSVQVTDSGGNTFIDDITIEIVEFGSISGGGGGGAGLGVPTVTPLSTNSRRPSITGTYDNVNAIGLEITISGISDPGFVSLTYILGTDARLTTSGSNWTLDLSEAPEVDLPYGTYSVEAFSFDFSGSTVDATSEELTIEVSSRSRSRVSQNIFVVRSYIYGCTYPQALNYKETAAWDDGSCIFDLYGSTTNPLVIFEEQDDIIFDLNVEECLYFNQYLSRGSNTNSPQEVEKWQKYFNRVLGVGLPETGFFGSLTEEAVRDFQTMFARYILEPWDLDEPTGQIYQTTRSFGNASLGCSEGTITLPDGEVLDHGEISF